MSRATVELLLSASTARIGRGDRERYTTASGWLGALRIRQHFLLLQHVDAAPPSSARILEESSHEIRSGTNDSATLHLTLVDTRMQELVNGFGELVGRERSCSLEYFRFIFFTHFSPLLRVQKYSSEQDPPGSTHGTPSICESGSKYRLSPGDKEIFRRLIGSGVFSGDPACDFRSMRLFAFYVPYQS